MRTLIIGILVVLFTASCKTSNVLESRKSKNTTLDSAFNYTANFEYKIKKQDKISISVWGQDELSVGSIYGIYNSNEIYGKWLMVDMKGCIEIPKMGTLKVENFTVLLLKDTLKTLLSKWLINPIVDVKILNKEITIMGEVKSPQVFVMDKDETKLLDLIAKSGGLDFYANLKQIKVLRQDGLNVKVATIDLSKQKNYLQQNLQLFPGDVVIVPSQKFKAFDKRVSTIIPFTNTATAGAILFGIFK